MAKARKSKGQGLGGGAATLLALSAMSGAYEPQSSEYEQDDDGFREGEGTMKAGASLRCTTPEAVAWLQSHCSRRHVPRGHPRVCQLCLIDIPAR